MLFSFRSAVLASAALIAIPSPLFAQEAAADLLAADESGGEEIVVTGSRRRDEDAQEVPIALSIVSAEALERRGDYTLGQIQQQVPSLQVFSFNPRNTNINIRGLGSNVALTNDGLENGVGFYIDNVYYGRVGLSQFDLVDLERIEVLRGPQGTLFGKNTTSGVINITSRKPSFDPEFSGEASIGNYSYYQFRASASGPLIADKLAIRLSGAITQNDGFLYNVTQRERAQDYSNKTIRGQLLFTPTEDVSLRLIGDFSSRTSRTVKKERARDTSPLESPRAGRSSPLFRPAHPAATRMAHELFTRDLFPPDRGARAFVRTSSRRSAAQAEFPDHRRGRSGLF